MTVAPDRRPRDSGVPGEPGDTDNRKSSENIEPSSAERVWFGELVELLGPPAALLDHQCRIVAVNTRFCELSRAARQSLIGRHVGDVGNGVLNIQDLQEALVALQADERQTNLPVASKPSVAARVWRIPTASGPANSLLIIGDVSERSISGKRSRSGLPNAAPGLRGPLSVETLHHDLRQPLQTLSLLQGILAVREGDPALRKHIAHVKVAIEALGGLLNVLDDIERQSANPASPRCVDFPISQVLSRLRSEFSYHAEARGLSMSVVPSRAVVHSDSGLLERIIRALLLVAVNMLKRGKVLLGCRRRRANLSIEVWISGEETPSQQQNAVLAEFHRSTLARNGKGIAPSIVLPLTDILGLSVKARSRPGTGLVFTVDVPTSPISQSVVAADASLGSSVTDKTSVKGTVAVVSDSPREREALTLLLRATGYQVVAAHIDGELTLERSGSMKPEIIVADFGRLTDLGGTRVIEELRRLLRSHTPAMIIADEAWRSAQSRDIIEPVTYLSKPVAAEEIIARVGQAVLTARSRLVLPRTKDRHAPQQTAFIVDDDRVLREAISALLMARGECVESYSSGESFLEDYTPVRRGCLVVDDKLPGLRGVELLEKLKADGATLPAIMITGHGDIETAVRAMKAGAIDYIEKPVFDERLLSAIDQALEIDKGSADFLARQRRLAARFATLTQRERQVLDLVVKGASSKSIGRALNISQRTVETHRAGVMKRVGATSLSDLIRIVMQLNSFKVQ